MSKFSIAVLISGGGTTLRNLIEKKNQGGNAALRAEISLVISSDPRAAGIEFAKQEGIPLEILDHRQFQSPQAISQRIFEMCRQRSIDLVVLGGFLRKLAIPDDYKNRVINIHPSLIPEFCGKGLYGMRVHQAVIDSGTNKSGCTVHFVDDQYDHGPIIAQRSVDVRPDDSPAQLAARVFQQECTLYPQVINAIAAGQVKVTDDRVVIHSGDLGTG